MTRDTAELLATHTCTADTARNLNQAAKSHRAIVTTVTSLHDLTLDPLVPMNVFGQPHPHPLAPMKVFHHLQPHPLVPMNVFDRLHPPHHLGMTWEGEKIGDLETLAILHPERTIAAPAAVPARARAMIVTIIMTTMIIVMLDVQTILTPSMKGVITPPTSPTVLGIQTLVILARAILLVIIRRDHLLGVCQVTPIPTTIGLHLATSRVVLITFRIGDMGDASRTDNRRPMRSLLLGKSAVRMLDLWRFGRTEHARI